AADGKSFEFSQQGRRLHYNVDTKQLTDALPPTPPGGRGRGGGAPARGRQFDFAIAPAGNHRATYRDRNLWVGDSTGAHAVQITSDGSVQSRIKYGTASWVYGEELDQTTAMWWSPDGKKLAYYRFDEGKVPDFYLATGLTKIQDSLDVEAYPKSGAPNPVVDLFVYDVDTKATTRIDVRDGKPFENDVVGYYVYHVAWSPDGRELLFNRTNRRQNIMELTACDPTNGKCRVVIRESWPTGWVENSPLMIFLKDRQHFIWQSERSGFANYYLCDLNGAMVPLTQHPFEVAQIAAIDEEGKALYYMARSGDNYMKLQLHRVGL